MRRPRVPIGLPIAIVALVILGMIAMRVIPAVVPEAELNKNVLLSAIPFILIFIAVLLVYIMLIVIVATAINDRVNRSLYTHGFQLLFIATLSYIMWSHVRPARVVERTPTVDAAA